MPDNNTTGNVKGDDYNSTVIIYSTAYNWVR